MCSGSKSRLSSTSFVMEGEFQKQNDGFFCECSVLLELSAMDDLEAFRSEVEVNGLDANKASFWYCRRIGSKKMAFEERTPLMIASMFGSAKVLKYIIESGKVDVNRVCGSDRVTALHCAVAGGTNSSPEIVKLLLDVSADAQSVNANGNKPVDLIGSALKSPFNSNRRVMQLLLKGNNPVGERETTMDDEEEQQKITMPQLPKEGTEKKEYPIDVSLPDINNGIYGTDEFRMYTFKVKPCSRAYSHDWTECPFVHPGENARRRDPRKYPYSCVPCPEFRKGTCQKGDACEYAHGVFESWLHPAQYRTRLCKDETGCSRKVCFFAHKPEELRPVYASTGSAMPSPKSHSSGAMDMTVMSPLVLSSSSLPMPTASTPPMSPLAAASSPKGGSLWQNKLTLTPPALQLPGSRLKTALSARDLDLEMELLGLENRASQQQQQQQLIDEITRLSSPSPSPSYWNNEFSRIGDLQPTNLDDVFGSVDPSPLSHLQGLSLKPTTPTQLQSPNGLQMRQNVTQLRASYPNILSSSPVRKPSSFGYDSSAAVAAAVMNSRSAAFAKRSQSFIDRGTGTHLPGLAATGNSVSMMSSTRSDWSSPDGKLDWGIQGDELNKLKKSASFRFRDNNVGPATTLMPSRVDEPDVSWVNSLVKDVSHETSGLFGAEKRQYNRGNGGNERLPPWVEQLYIEQEQMVA
ncbi:Zinc finger CCCH domain-containing protein 29 [Morella rubra]|uniref:Zinc finger CCCH domain-containing protein 29 n=1 Tax=Morella rubra TaxID=262757 RepID=A0A6A1VXN6_9ROSI|nr:Zinc finger CCCH domain-containing protein 29 [Morella rubra]KAB1217691.1 Zinc finger CCCH domain-containing protein 29 [Morella rubra]KAB1217725.1 Zinc finger CCCH domain-containing protein 29 [Morella rubra]